MLATVDVWALHAQCLSSACDGRTLAKPEREREPSPSESEPSQRERERERESGHRA